MKKNVFFLIVCLIVIPVINGYSQHYDPWSIQIKGGVNRNRGIDGFPADFGLGAEYTLSPIIGVGLECMRMGVDVPRHKDRGEWHAAKSSAVYQTVALVSLNLTNLTVRSNNGFNVYVNLGAGVGFGDWDFESKKNANVAAVGGLNFEYNLSDHFAVGAEVRYWWNSNAKYHGGYGEKEDICMSGNKDFYDANLNFRYKITSWKRRGYHVRDADITRSKRF